MLANEDAQDECSRDENVEVDVGKIRKDSYRNECYGSI